LDAQAEYTQILEELVHVLEDATVLPIDDRIPVVQEAYQRRRDAFRRYMNAIEALRASEPHAFEKLGP
jgi:hypothetical protein